MGQAILYRQDSGIAAIIHPAPSALAVMGIAAIAEKDVPTGKPYKIITEADIPADRATRNSWMVLDVDLTDGIGG